MSMNQYWSKIFKRSENGSKQKTDISAPLVQHLIYYIDPADLILFN